MAGLADSVSARAIVRYFGTGPAVGGQPLGARVQDSDHCPECGRPLVYRRVTFSHLGDCCCPEGHVERPRSDVTLSSLAENGSGGSRVRFETDYAQADMLLPLSGLPNAYDALAAVTLATWLGLDLATAASALADMGPAFGRGESVAYQERDFTLILEKNPVSFTQALSTFLACGEGRPALFLVKRPSGRWDRRLLALGRGLRGHRRVLSTRYRRRYAGVRPGCEAALRGRLGRGGARSESRPGAGDRGHPPGGGDRGHPPPGEELLVFATYTAMLDLRLALARKQPLKAFWR